MISHFRKTSWIHSCVIQKTNLVLYLASKLISIHRDVGTFHLQLCVTYKDNVISLSSLMNHSPFQIEITAEEADQKIVRHTHCISEEYTDIEIQSIDHDVLILLLAYVAIQMASSNNHAVNVFFQTRNTQSPPGITLFPLQRNWVQISVTRNTQSPLV